MSRLIETTVLLVVIFVFLQCEVSNGLGQEASDTDESASGDGDSDTDGNEDSDAVPDMNPLFCVKVCSGAQDCIEPGADQLHDEDNYSCEDGLCVYQGCNGNSECEEVYPGLGFTCAEEGCIESCYSSSDCAIDLEPFWDEDNWNCSDNVCHYIGCISDGECTSSMGNMYSCQDVMSTGVPVCHLNCDDEIDCITQTGQAYDEDNYLCRSGKCYYTGCKSDDECGEGYRCVTP